MSIYLRPAPETPPSASLNRVRIMDLPGLPLEDAVRGRRGDELLSSRALIACAARFSEALGLGTLALSEETLRIVQGDVGLRVRVPRLVADALDSPHAGRRRAAEAVASRLGRNLGWLLIALHRGDAANRSVRPDWSAEDWERWGSVRQVWLGGGLAGSRLGERLAAEARSLLEELGYGDIRVDVSPHGGHIALVGAARLYANTSPLEGTRTVLGLDFGHTLVKRAVLSYRHGVLRQLDPLLSLPVDWRQILPPPWEPHADGSRVLLFLEEVIAGAIAEAAHSEPVALVSIAAYTKGGRVLGNGPYASIHAGQGDRTADSIVAEAVQQRTGRPLLVRLIHDGTAASLAHAGSPNSAVIMLGTALGVGFPPDDKGYKALS